MNVALTGEGSSDRVQPQAGCSARSSLAGSGASAIGVLLWPLLVARRRR